MVCTLIEKDGIQDWCERHKMRHNGHYAAYAVDPGEKGEKFRQFWDMQSQPKRLLRSLPMVKQCTYLGEKLTPEEIKEKQLAGCSSCSSAKPYHCTLPGAKKFNDGPYTRIAECANCTDWKKKESEPGAMSFDPIRFDHFNLHPGAIPGVRFNSSIIESI